MVYHFSGTSSRVTFIPFSLVKVPREVKRMAKPCPSNYNEADKNIACTLEANHGGPHRWENTEYAPDGRVIGRVEE